MKKKARSILFCVLALVLSLMFAAFFAACGGTNETDPDDPDPGKDPGGDGPATVTELVIDTPPDTTEYYAGEAFDPTGMVVKAKWSDGLTVSVGMSECTITPAGALSVSDKSVTITYEGKSVTQAINVKDIVVSSVTVDTGNTALKAAAGDVIDLSDMVVTAHYADGGSRVIGSGYTFELDGEPIDDVSAIVIEDWGTHTLEVVYGEASAKIELEIFDGFVIEAENIISADKVTEDTVNYVEIVKGADYGSPVARSVPGEPASGDAYMGSVFKGSVIRFHVYAEEACYADVILRAASCYMTVDGGAWSPMKVDEQQFNRLFEVSYGSAADAEADTLERLYVDDDVILAGSETDKPGGDPLLLVNWMDVTFGTLPLEQGDNVIEFNVVTDYVNCKGEPIACNIDRLEIVYTDDYTPPATATELIVKTPPTKTEYKSGESFDPAGMVVEAKMSDGTTETPDISELEISPAGPLSVGDDEVTISYRGATAVQAITVTAASKVTVEGENIYKAAELPEGMKNWVEVVSGMGKANNERGSGASGGKYLGTTHAGDVIRFHIWADNAGSGKITVRAASTNILSGGWACEEVGDSKLNDYASFRFGSGDSLAPVTVDDSVILPGVKETEHADPLARLENWINVELGTFDFAAGDNILELTVDPDIPVNPDTWEASGCNIDSVTVEFA